MSKNSMEKVYYRFITALTEEVKERGYVYDDKGHFLKISVRVNADVPVADYGDQFMELAVLFNDSICEVQNEVSYVDAYSWNGISYDSKIIERSFMHDEFINAVYFSELCEVI